MRCRQIRIELSLKTRAAALPVAIALLAGGLNGCQTEEKRAEAERQAAVKAAAELQLCNQLYARSSEESWLEKSHREALGIPLTRSQPCDGLTKEQVREAIANKAPR